MTKLEQISRGDVVKALLESGMEAFHEKINQIVVIDDKSPTGLSIEHHSARYRVVPMTEEQIENIDFF